MTRHDDVTVVRPVVAWGTWIADDTPPLPWYALAIRVSRAIAAHATEALVAIECMAIGGAATASWLGQLDAMAALMGLGCWVHLWRVRFAAK